MFTAGNIAWTLGRDRSYLATKDEVLDHFEHCVNVIRQRVQVEEFFGWAVQSHEEADGVVRITCRSSDGQRRVIEAKRLIKAYGFQSKPNDPLEISSERVLSVSPDYCDMRCDEMRASDERLRYHSGIRGSWKKRMYQEASPCLLVSKALKNAPGCGTDIEVTVSSRSGYS
jgi:hypothetical protein